MTRGKNIYIENGAIEFNILSDFDSDLTQHFSLSIFFWGVRYQYRDQVWIQI
jgi:hypothetical protein